MIQKSLRTVDPGARAGLSGTQAPAAGNGMDWWRLSQAFSFYHSYNTAWSEEMRRSFRKSTGVMTSPYYAGYWGAGRGLEHNVWWCLLNDTTSISAWTTSLFFYGDLSFSEAGRDTRDYINELKDGPWDLLRNSVRQDDGIAIHYSQPSVHAAYILGRAEEFDKSRSAWGTLLYDAGLQFDFIAYAEIEKGELSKRKYRALILPQSIAISEAEAKEVEAFVKAGGTVIADSAVAIMDDHCRTLETPRLDALFGIKRAPPAASTKIADGFRLTATVGALAAETSVKLTGAEREVSAACATALGVSADGFPVILVNKSGKGTAVYLNLGLTQYSDDRKFHSPAETHTQQMVLALLGQAGVAPKVSVAFES
jgi:hypothetical protein